MKEFQEQFNKKKEDYEKRIAAAREANKKLRVDSQEDEVTRQRLAKRHETDVDKKIQEYDKEIKTLAGHLNEYQEGYKKEQKQLQELREHFVKVDAEKECIAREEELEEARRTKLANE